MPVRYATLAILFTLTVVAPAAAQQDAPNPTAQSVNEQQLLQQLRKIDVTRDHRVERTLHPDRTDVDVSKDNGGENHARHRMHILRDLNSPDLD